MFSFMHFTQSEARRTLAVCPPRTRFRSATMRVRLPVAGRHGSRPWAGPALMFGGALSNQLGAATGALACGEIGPAGVVAIRQWIAGIVLLAAGRPRWRSFTGAQWRPVLLLAAAYGTMNLSLYTALGRLGLGPAG